MSIIENQKDVLFDYCVRMGTGNGGLYKEEWDKRAEQVINGIVTDELFAIWLSRRIDEEAFGEYAKDLLEVYYK